MSLDFEVAVVLGLVGLILLWGAVVVGLLWLVWPDIRRWRRQRRHGGEIPSEVLAAASDRARSTREEAGRGSSHSARSRRSTTPRWNGASESSFVNSEGSHERTDGVGGA